MFWHSFRLIHVLGALSKTFARIVAPFRCSWSVTVRFEQTQKVELTHIECGSRVRMLKCLPIVDWIVGRYSLPRPGCGIAELHVVDIVAETRNTSVAERLEQLGDGRTERIQQVA
jgi:hypothetical protein